MRTPEQIVQAEICACVSYLVATLGINNDYAHGADDLGTLMDQAVDLFVSEPDYEEAALQAGWVLQANQCDYRHPDSDQVYNNVETLCDCEDIEPYYTEVYEHWIVTDWFADRLIEQGEKVDKDFASLCVWARTTTGQAIYADSVVERIAAAHCDWVKP